MGLYTKLWNDPGPDSGWSWVVAFSCCWITTGMYGIVRSSGFLYVAVIELFGISRKEAALPFSVLLSFSNFIGLFGSILLQFASMRQIVFGGSVMACVGLIMCYFAKSVLWITVWIGVLTGSGIGLSTSFLTVLISQYFKKARTTANGIYLSGRSISGFLFPPLIYLLLTTFDLRGTCLILGAIISHTLLGASFLRPRNAANFPEKLSTKQSEESKTFLHSSNIAEHEHESDMQIVNHLSQNGNHECQVKLNGDSGGVVSLQRNTSKRSVFVKRCSKYVKTCFHLVRKPIYILNCLTDTYHAFTITAMGLTLVDFSLDNGFSMNFALAVLLAINVSDLVARIFTGFISDRGYLSRQTLISITLSLAGGALFMMTLASVSYVFIILCALYGIMMGCAIINIVAFYTEYMTQEELPIGIGLGNFVKGFIFLLQSVLIGYFRDKVGSYVYLYYLFAFLAPTLGFLWFLLVMMKKFNCKGNTNTVDKKASQQENNL